MMVEVNCQSSASAAPNAACRMKSLTRNFESIEVVTAAASGGRAFWKANFEISPELSSTPPES